MIRFKEIYEIWRRDNSLTQALKASYYMLEKTEPMFRQSVRSLRERNDGGISINIYEEDRLINQYQREVRKKVLRHLAVTGGINVISGLILTSIVIDIERIGDYTKNITELSVAHPEKLSGGRHEDDIRKVEQASGQLFEEIVAILQASDRARARRLLSETIWIRKRCDEIDLGLIKAPDLDMSSRDAVTIALYVRYLKRVGVHLQNILTSVVNPFERIGYREEDETLSTP